MTLMTPFSLAGTRMVCATASGLALSFFALLLAGCAAPIGAERVTTRDAYAQVEASALGTGQPSGSTVSSLHRFNLDFLAVRQPDEALRQLHQKAVAVGERDLLFALAELSYVAGNHIRRSVKPWDPRDARDYYLGSAVYAWLFLFGESKDAPPSPFDRRFREPCDLYTTVSVWLSPDEGVVVIWLVIIFFSFALFAPPNATATLALTVSALSVAGAIFLILEMDRPFTGLIQISSEPLVNALSKTAR